MKNIVYILRKYWKKHIRTAVSLIFSSMLVAAVMTSALLMYRTTFNRKLNELYDYNGMFDICMRNIPEDFISEITSGKSDLVRSDIYVYGKIGQDEFEYTYGYADDTAQALMHIPFESGRMPKTQGEIAIARAALTQMNWTGSVGESIVFDDETYKVVGIIDEIYTNQRVDSELYEFDDAYSAYPIPSIYVFDADNIDNAEYKITLIDNFFQNENDIEKDGEEAEKCVDLFYERFDGEEALQCMAQTKSLNAESVLKSDEFRFDCRMLIILSVFACAIAILSVFAVLRNVFQSRKNHDRLLCRIGMSHKSMKLMYAFECIALIIVQSFIGIALGIAVYAAIYKYQVDVLEMTPYSAFTTDKLITENTYSPYIVPFIFSAIITSVAYLITALTSSYKTRTKLKPKAKASPLRSNINKVFSQKTITAIQTVALTLIVFGTMLGYMYNTDNGKEYLNGLKFDFPETYEVSIGFDMEKDGIDEYYSCSAPISQGIASLEDGKCIMNFADNEFDSGISDDIVSKYDDVIACGELEQTFIFTDSENKNYNRKIKLESDLQKEFLISVSDEQYSNFFDEGQLGSKCLYSISTRLACANAIEKLSPYVTQGSIDINKLNDGTHIIMIVTTDDGKYNVGDVISVGSIMSNGNYGIGDVAKSTVEISAVVVLPNDCDKVLKYAVMGDNVKNLLTTSLGAENMQLHNAAYTELFSAEDIDGGLIPAKAHMTMVSYSDIKKRERIDAAMEYGGMALLIVIMSLLGLSAYFNGIGLKMKAKQYDIAVLRAIGTPVSYIRKKVMIDNLKLPLIASAVAGIGVAAVQKVTAAAYDRLIALMELSNIGEIDNSEEQLELIDKYFLENQLWVVSILKPLIIVAGIMCLITVVLTLISLKRLDENIADSLNTGRERK